MPLLSSRNYRDIPGLAEFPDKPLKSLLLKCVEIDYKKGCVVFSEGQSADYVWFVLKGKVSMGGCTRNGGESANCIAGNKDFFCCLPTMDRKPYPVTAVCEENSRLLRIPIDDYHKAATRDLTTMQKIMSLICAKLRTIERRHSRIRDNAQERILSVLRQYCQQYGYSFKATRAEIAKLAATTPETTIRYLSNLKKKGIIGGGRGSIEILNAAYFES